MTRRDCAAGVATYGGALILLIGLIGGWTWPLALGGVALAVGLLALNATDSAPPRAPDGRTYPTPSPVTPTPPRAVKAPPESQGETK